MRLGPEELKQKLLHPDPEVRSQVAYYFAHSPAADATIMPLVIEAIERFGRSAAFKHYGFIADLPLRDDTLAWALDELRRRDEFDLQVEDDLAELRLGYFDCLADCVASAEAPLLVRHAAVIEGLETLDHRARTAIAEKVQLAARTPDDLWHELEAICQSRAGDPDFGQEMYEHARRLVLAMATYPAELQDRVLKLLADPPADLETPQGWLFSFALALAAEMRLEQALPLVADLLDTEDDFNREECERLFMRVGSEEAVNTIAAKFLHGESEFSQLVAFCLEHIHTDHAVATSLALVPHAADTELQCQLLSAALLNFATEAIEPARQFVLATPLDPEVLEVRSHLLVACDVLGISFPEQEEWRKARAGDQEFRKNWYAQHGRFSERPQRFPVDDDFDDDPPAEDYLDEDVRFAAQTTIHNEQPRVGRNDPCPCGSGKKFKKCCLPKMRENPLAN